QPVGRDFDRRAGLPPAIADAFFANRRIGLGRALEWAETQHLPPACPDVVAHAVNIQREGRRRIGADMKGDFFSTPAAGSRAITFDPRTPVFCLRVNAGVRQQPVTRPGPGVLTADQVALGGNGFSGDAGGVFPDLSEAWERGHRAEADGAFDQVSTGDATFVSWGVGTSTGAVVLLFHNFSAVTVLSAAMRPPVG